MTEERKSVIEEVRINQGLLQEIIIEISEIQKKITSILEHESTCQCKKEFEELKRIILDIPYEPGTGSKPERKFYNFQPPPNLPWIKEKESKELIKK